MFIKNEDINTLIKMENLIGINEKLIFGESKDKSITVNKTEIAYDDFITFINLIDKMITNKKKLADKSNAYNKAHPEKHRQHNKDYARRKKLRKEAK